MKEKFKGSNFPNLRFPGFEGEWEEIKIGEILKIGNGKDYKHLQNGSVPVFGTGGFMKSVNNYLYDGETVFIGRKGTINKPFYYNGKFWTVDTLFYTHSFDKVRPKFVFNLFQQVNWLQYNEASGVPSLSKSTIENIQVNIPTISEQLKISSLFSLIEERIKLSMKIIEDLTKMKYTIAQKIFTQKIKFKIIREEVFKDWETKTLGEVSIITMGQSPDSSSYNTIENGLPLIQGNADLINRKSEPRQFTNQYTKLCDIGDILLTVRAPVGFTAKSQHKACIGRGICAIKNNSESNSEFIYQFLLFFENKWSSLEQGSTFSSVNSLDIKSIKINVPCLEEQNKIAQFLSLQDEKINLEKDLLIQYESQKRYLLTNLFI